MTGTHRISDIAEQSGLSAATVDRVLHGRPGVSTRAVRQVEQAMAELDRQQRQLRLGARTMLIDVVMQTPTRFSEAVRTALESELTAGPAAVRARFEVWESGPVDRMVRTLDRLGRKGRTCHGVIAKAPDDPEVAAAIGRLAARGIPVVTLVTDVPDSGRSAYVGLDNESAGRTAAYLTRQWLGGRPGAALVTLSSSSFFGERERLQGFTIGLGDRELLVCTDTDGVDSTMRRRLAELLVRHRDIAAVYSAGGGNVAIAESLAAQGTTPTVFLGHDLDADNTPLLLDGTLHAVLHHDLRADLRAAVRQLLRANKLLPGPPRSVHSRPQVITPLNLPAVQW